LNNAARINFGTKKAIDLARTSFTLKVNAFAGAGKTSTLVEMAKALPHERILYICFNKSIADEASKKFPSNVQCKTVHSLAYGSIVIPDPRFNTSRGILHPSLFHSLWMENS
jgi:superfamily I DNA and RNA helicase